MTKIIVTDEEINIAKILARKFASRWKAADWEDVNGHLLLWMCQHQNNMERWRKEEGGMGKLHVTLSREASKFCSNEQTHQNGGVLSYNLEYSPTQVEAALPFMWDFTHSNMQRSVPMHPTFGTPIVDTLPLSSQSFDDALAVLADISSGYYGLTKGDQTILELRFREDFTFRKIGKTMNITEDAARKRVDRAVQRLAGKLTLGGDPDAKYRKPSNEQGDY